MTPRERVLAAINRRRPDKLPKTISFTGPVLQAFRARTGADNPLDHFGTETRWVGFHPTRRETDWARFLPDLPAGAVFSEWGVGYLKRKDTHYFRYAGPMRAFTSVDQIRSYPYPDVTADYRHEDLEARVAALHEREWAVAGSVTPEGGAFFEAAWVLRDFDMLLLDFAANPEMAEALLNEVVSRSVFMARRLAEAGVDFIYTGDDVGTERAMLISPATWRRFLKPRLARVIAAARAVRPDIPVFYHSDGYCEPIIPELIEIGVTILNPVQPECMDPAELKRRFGDRLAFWGTVGTQTTMPFGTPDDVRREVRHRFETVGLGGGLVIAPTQTIEPDVPWENIVAFFEAVEECRYG
jgi:uroporphyrinogen decarboxylase